jgi:hypothetical protein
MQMSRRHYTPLQGLEPTRFASSQRSRLLAVLHAGRFLLQVFHRLAPLKRGLWEDHVANFWCTTSMLPIRFFKWKKRLHIEAAAQLAGVTTITACLPLMWHQVRRPSKQGLLLAMLISGLAFFLFSFQGERYRTNVILESHRLGSRYNCPWDSAGF